MALACASVVTLAGAAAQTSNAPRAFDIPSQSLDAALSRYGDLTGREALYDASIAAGRVSADVHGVLTPNEALDRLLSGTGLSPRFVADNSFVLLSAPQSAAAGPARAMPAAHQRYYATIQHSLLDALCRTRDAQPGRYRLVAVFWIGAAGRVERAQRIGSAGSAEADRQIDVTLSGMMFDAPPADFGQPVLVLLVPQAPNMRAVCDGVGAAVRRTAP